MGRARRRLRKAAAADVGPRRRERRRRGAPTAGGSRSRRSATTTRSRRSTCSTSPAAARRAASRRRRSPRARRVGARTAGRSPTRAPSTRARRTSSEPQARRRAQGGEVEACARYETFPIRRWDKWLDETRTHVFVDRRGRRRAARDLLAGTKLAAERGVRGRRRRGLERRPAARCSPRRPLARDRGAHVNRTDAAYAPTNTHLYEVALDGGEPRALTAGTATLRLAALRARRASLCATASAEEWGRIYALDRLACAPWPWTARRPRGDRRVRPLGRRLRVRARLAHPVPHRRGRGVRAPVLRPGEGRRGRRRCSSRRGAFGAIESPEGAASPVIVAGWGSATEPVEIVRVDPAARTPHPADRLRRRGRRRARLAAARGVLVHERDGPARPQLRGRCRRASIPRGSTRCSC